MVLSEDLYFGLSPVLKLVNFSFELFWRLSLKSKDKATPFGNKEGKECWYCLGLICEYVKAEFYVSWNHMMSLEQCFEDCFCKAGVKEHLILC